MPKGVCGECGEFTHITMADGVCFKCYGVIVRLTVEENMPRCFGCKKVPLHNSGGKVIYCINCLSVMKNPRFLKFENGVAIYQCQGCLTGETKVPDGVCVACVKKIIQTKGTKETLKELGYSPQQSKDILLEIKKMAVKKTLDEVQYPQDLSSIQNSINETLFQMKQFSEAELKKCPRCNNAFILDDRPLCLTCDAESHFMDVGNWEPMKRPVNGKIYLLHDEGSKTNLIGVRPLQDDPPWIQRFLYNYAGGFVAIRQHQDSKMWECDCSPNSSSALPCEHLKVLGLEVAAGWGCKNTKLVVEGAVKKKGGPDLSPAAWAEREKSFAENAKAMKEGKPYSTPEELVTGPRPPSKINLSYVGSGVQVHFDAPTIGPKPDKYVLTDNFKNVLGTWYNSPGFLLLKDEDGWQKKQFRLYSSRGPDWSIDYKTFVVEKQGSANAVEIPKAPFTAQVGYAGQGESVAKILIYFTPPTSGPTPTSYLVTDDKGKSVRMGYESPISIDAPGGYWDTITFRIYSVNKKGRSQNWYTAIAINPKKPAIPKSSSGFYFKKVKPDDDTPIMYDHTIHGNGKVETKPIPSPEPPKKPKDQILKFGGKRKFAKTDEDV